MKKGRGSPFTARVLLPVIVITLSVLLPARTMAQAPQPSPAPGTHVDIGGLRYAPYNDNRILRELVMPS